MMDDQGENRNQRASKRKVAEGILIVGEKYYWGYRRVPPCSAQHEDQGASEMDQATLVGYCLYDYAGCVGCVKNIERDSSPFGEQGPSRDP